MSHRDGQPHVHVIANRVDPESGQAAGLNRSKLSNYSGSTTMMLPANQE